MEEKEVGVTAQNQRLFKKKKRRQAREASSKVAVSKEVSSEEKDYFTPPLMVSETAQSQSIKSFFISFNYNYFSF